MAAVSRARPPSTWSSWRPSWRTGAGCGQRSGGCASARPPSPPDRCAPTRSRARSSRSAWPPSTRRRTCSGDRSSRSARRPTATGCAWSATTAATPRASPRLEAELEGDPRFAGLALAAAARLLRATSSARCRWRRQSAEYVAMADQDDSWHPDKLATLLAAIGDARLVYSDARIVSRAGELLADTYWSQRRNNHTDLASLLMANSVTGAASLFAPRAARAGAAVPAAPQFAHFHDHWVALRRAGDRRHRLRRPAALRLRPARRSGARPRRGQPDDGGAHPARAARRRSARPGSRGGGCTTSWTTAAWSSSRRCSSCAVATGWRLPKRRALDSRASPPTARCWRWAGWRRARRASSRAPETLGAESGCRWRSCGGGLLALSRPISSGRDGASAGRRAAAQPGAQAGPHRP